MQLCTKAGEFDLNEFAWIGKDKPATLDVVEIIFWIVGAGNFCLTIGWYGKVGNAFTTCGEDL